VATSLLPAPATRTSAALFEGATWRTRVDTLALAVVLVAALVSTALAYTSFLGVHRHLWDGGGHDRNAHYLTALKLGLGLRHTDVYAFCEEIIHCNVWPPLHGLLVGLVVAVAGPDYRLAVLPNLLALAAAAVLAFLTARRAAPRGGNLAGLVAAMLILCSPTYRGYATDLMLENLGACLSLASLYAYLRAVQDDSPGAGRWLAVALTALFLVKYNYWLLVVLALAAADLTTNSGDRWRSLVAQAGPIAWRAWLGRQLRHPATYLLAAVLALVALVNANGDQPLHLQGRDLKLYPPHNIFHIAYVVIFLRLAAWWRSGGCDWTARLETWARPLAAWHAWPVAIYMLLPRRPSLFLWYLSPHNAPAFQKVSFTQGVAFYSQVLVTHYHIALWSALAVLTLFAVALVTVRSLRPGGRAVLFLAVIGAVLTMNHPNRQGRYAHTWLAAGWVGAALGLAALLPRRRTSRLAWPRATLAGAVGVALLAAHVPALADVGPRAPESGPQPQRPSMLDLTDCCEPDLEASARAVVLTTLEMKWPVLWTTLVRDGSLAKLEDRWYGFAGAGLDNRHGFQRWLESTRVDTIVLFDRARDRPPSFVEGVLGECHSAEEIHDLLMAQTTFPLVKRQDFRDHGCTVYVWRR
jgi:hypothetical protein